jgi:DNA mismatch repair ATPase MutS
MHDFKIDEQTLKDLDIFSTLYGKSNADVFSLFDCTQTDEGSRIILDLFRSPTTDLNKIRSRQNLIKSLEERAFEFNLNNSEMLEIDNYLNFQPKNIGRSKIRGLFSFLDFSYHNQVEFYRIKKSVNDITNLLKVLNNFYNYDFHSSSKILEEYKSSFRKLYDDLDIEDISRNIKGKFIKLKIYSIDKIFRDRYYKEIKETIASVYILDAYQSIAKAMKIHDFVIPTIENIKDSSEVKIDGLFHPLILNPVRNDLQFVPNKNVYFLTGANMAGKSTYMKAFGIAIMLAHIGLPVPAKSMKTGIFNGLLTTINLPDDISKGYSHFYNEVIRIKNIFEILKSRTEVIVIFDELFRGTNYSDACHATLKIIGLFTEISDRYFFISSHLSEVGKELKKNERIDFKHISARFIDGKLIFPYKIEDGISTDQLGLYILNQEKIFDLISEIGVLPS